MDDVVRAFHLEEYKLIKQDMSVQMARIEILARRGILVAAAVFAWLVVQGVAPASQEGWCLKIPLALLIPAWFIPFAYAVLSGFAALAAYLRAHEIAAYIRTLEGILASPGLGWETTLEPKPPNLTRMALSFWTALLVITAVGGVAGTLIVAGINQLCPLSK